MNTVSKPNKMQLPSALWCWDNAQTVLKPMLVAGLALMLVSCGNEEGDDVDQFIRNSAKTMQPKIAPLPEVAPYTALQYNADGTLVDPFQARKAASVKSQLQPDVNRAREPMESYPLESVKYVGQLSKKKLTYALLKASDNVVYQVKVGNYVGQNFGRVSEITDSEVTLKETVQDELTGDWVERIASLALQEQ